MRRSPFREAGRRRAAAVLLLAGLGSAACLAAPAPSLVIDAPAPLKALLEKNLDVERAARLPADQAPDEAEWERLLGVAPEQAQALARTEGFFRAQARVEPEPADPRRLHLRLDPGPPARVGRVTLQFDGELADRADRGEPAAVALEHEVQSHWSLPAGSVFRNADWDDAKAKVLSQLRADGYAATQWTATAAQVDPATDQVRVFLVVDSGPLFQLGDLVVVGLERQPEGTVRQLAGMGPGSALTQARLVDYQDRLLKTGLFDQATVIFNPDPAQAAHATLRVRVHEQSLQQAQVGLGYSTTTGPRVSLAHTDRLVFGRPATLSNQLQWGRELAQWDMSLTTHPGERFRRWLIGSSLSRVATTNDVVRAGSVRLGRTQDTTPLDRLTFVQFERSIQCTIYDCVDARALGLNQQGIWRDLDSVVLPTKGHSFSGQIGAGWAGGPASGYGPYTRLYGRYTGYWPLGHHWYSQGRLELGQIFVKRGVAMPDAEQWRAGGEGSVRGYAWRSLAPLDAYGQVVGGNALVTTSVEIAHPFTERMPSLWWAAFVDGGRAAPRFTALRMAWGYGLGVRWRSPVGPLQADWSWGQEKHAGRIDLGIGIAF